MVWLLTVSKKFLKTTHGHRSSYVGCAPNEVTSQQDCRCQTKLWSLMVSLYTTCRQARPKRMQHKIIKNYVITIQKALIDCKSPSKKYVLFRIILFIWYTILRSDSSLKSPWVNDNILQNDLATTTTTHIILDHVTWWRHSRLHEHSGLVISVSVHDETLQSTTTFNVHHHVTRH